MPLSVQLLYEPNDPEGILTLARPWTEGWSATVAAARAAVTEKLSRAAMTEGERVAEAAAQAKAPYKVLRKTSALPAPSCLLLCAHNSWVRCGQQPAVSAAGFSVGARVAVLPKARAAMISMRCDDDKTGGEVWEVVRTPPPRDWRRGPCARTLMGRGAPALTDL